MWPGSGPSSKVSATTVDGFCRQILGDVARNAALQLRRHAHRRADLARCAVAALEAVVLHKGLLQRMQRPRRTQPLDGGDFAAFVLHRQGEAAVDAFAVHQHGAGAARALVAALLGPGELQMLPQKVEQRCADIGRDLLIVSVDLEPHAASGWVAPLTRGAQRSSRRRGHYRLDPAPIAEAAVRRENYATSDQRTKPSRCARAGRVGAVVAFALAGGCGEP